MKTVEINKYKVADGAEIGDFVSVGFRNRNGYVSNTINLYGNYSIQLLLMIEKDFLIPSVRYDDGEIYGPFYNPDLRYNNFVYNSVADNYNRYMDKLVKLGLLVKEEDKPMGNIKFKRLNDLARIPKRATPNSAGYDLFAAIENPIVIKAGKTVKIGTGLAMELPDGYVGAIFARSGLATREGLRPANAVGLCDSDYRGEYIVALHNDLDKDAIVNPGDKIAQLVLLQYEEMVFEEVEELSDTIRGNGGFGSTGKN